MALADQDTSVVDRLGKTELVDTGLETALQEVLNLEGQDVIELHAGLVKDTDTYETANESVTLEEALGVLLVESKKRTGKLLANSYLAHCASIQLRAGSCNENLPSGTTDLGQGQLDAPDLTLVAETILADELQLGIPNPTLTCVPDISGARSRSVAMEYHIQTSGLERTTWDAVRLGVGTGRHCGCRGGRVEVGILVVDEGSEFRAEGANARTTPST